MQNSETEPAGVIRRRSASAQHNGTPSDEVYGLCAIYRAVLHRKVQKKSIEFINSAHRGYPKAYTGTPRG